jgi:hypothetical protein
MKVAIIMAGPYRGNKSIIENQLNMIGSYDTYVSCFEHYKEDWVNSGWPIKKIFVTPSINFNETNWSKQRNDNAGQSGFWQFWNLKNLIKNIPKHYDFYIKNRSDLFFDTDFSVDFKKLKGGTVYSPNNSFYTSDWDTNTWINDEFLLCDFKSLNIISDFVSEFYNKQRHQVNSVGPTFGSNEASLRLWLKENNIEVEKIYDFKYKKDHYGVTLPSGYVKFQLENI